MFFDRKFDTKSYFPALPKSENETGSIRGYVQSHPSNAGYKVCLDMNNDGELQENEEPFTITDNTGYYEFDNLEKGEYTVMQVAKNNWNIVTPSSQKYYIYLRTHDKIIRISILRIAFRNERINNLLFLVFFNKDKILKKIKK